MNYINQMNTFWRIESELELTPQATYLYFKLLNMNNGLGWATSFTKTEDESKGRLSHPAFIRARRDLVNAGLIEYEKRGANRAPRYTVFELTDKKVMDMTGVQFNMNCTPNHTPNYSPNGTPNHTPDDTPNRSPDTLIKLYKTRLDQMVSSPAASSALITSARTHDDFVEQLTRMHSTFDRELTEREIERVAMWLNHGVAVELVDCALTESDLAKKISVPYMESVLARFLHDGIKTRADYEMERMSRFKSDPFGSGPPANGPDIPLFKIGAESE